MFGCFHDVVFPLFLIVALEVDGVRLYIDMDNSGRTINYM